MSNHPCNCQESEYLCLNPEKCLKGREYEAAVSEAKYLNSKEYKDALEEANLDVKQIHYRDLVGVTPKLLPHANTAASNTSGVSGATLSLKSSQSVSSCCTCKKTYCLMLHCDCFAAGMYCAEQCGCGNCYNRREYEDLVSEALKWIESIDPFAFDPKIQNAKNEATTKSSGVMKPSDIDALWRRFEELNTEEVKVPDIEDLKKRLQHLNTE